MIEAAGGIVWRSGSGDHEVLLVHRPKYDDWSFPKGKLDPGEEAEQAALREVEEETGYTCRLGPELRETHYTDRKGRPKRVRYWAMTVVEGSFMANSEVDDVKWMAIDHARAALSYAHDVAVLDAFAAPGQE